MSQSESPRPAAAEVEVHRTHELVADEDVLSLDLRHALDQVGTAIGLVAAVALVFAHLKRARRAPVARVESTTGGAP